MFKKSVIFLFLFLFLIIVSFISLMYSGIKIDSFSFSNFSISQFYIKIDKRIILDVENIEYKSDKQGENNSIDSIKKDLELFPTILKISTAFATFLKAIVSNISNEIILIFS